MSPRMLTGFLFVTVLSFAILCSAGWYAVKIVIAAFSAAGSLYCGARDRCDCVQEQIAVLRNASLAQCAWVQATLLREKAAEALAATGLSQWLKHCENCEWIPDIWSLLALAFSFFIVSGARGCIKLNESTGAELFCIVGKWRRSVIKVLRFEYVVRHRDLVLAEVRIGSALQGIVANLHNTTVGLSRLRTVYCVWGKYPELLTSACRSYRERKGSGFVTDDDHDLCLPYVVLHMTFAGWPLSNVTLESPLQLWSVVQQVALTLAVAEEALEFEHRALSEDHVLVKKAHHDVLSFRLNGRLLHVNTFGVHAFLIDFCAARLRPLGDVEPLFTDLKKLPRKKRDAMGETFAKACNLVGEEPWQYCPKTNVACLEGLTRRLVKRFESRFAAAVDEAEQEAWCDMCFWLDEMPYCASATELALQMAM